MIMHQTHKFILNNRVAFTLPNNVCIDTSPDPCPIEGMVMRSEDLRIMIVINFVETEKEAEAFLEEGTEGFSDFVCLKAMAKVKTNGLEGATMSYSLRSEVYEEYVFTIPGDTPALLSICLEQQKDSSADDEEFVRIRDELLSGIAT